MTRNKTLLLTFGLLTSLVITGCDSGGGGGGGGGNNSNSSIASNTQSGTMSDGIQVFNNYDAYIDQYSQEDHLYIHYYREGATMEDYNKYGLWIWPSSPLDSAGALFAASTTPSGFTSNTKGWMTSIGVNGSIDQAGVCADIDLTNTSYVTGAKKEKWSIADSTRVGYLVVELSSMSGETLWVKDGGGNGYLSNFQTNFRDNGSIHVFIKSGNATNPTYYYSEDTYTNPVVNDTTGQYVSHRDINNSSITSYPNSPTSKLFSQTGAVGYQVFIPSFADSNGDGLGDLRGVINKLSYLDTLNVDTLWLSPFLQCNSYHGYDTIDYYSVDERYGTHEDLRELLYKAHQLGMKVVMDLVINHASNTGIWFKKAQAGEKGKTRDGKEFEYRDLFHFLYKGNKTLKNLNVENDPSWYRDGESNYYYYAKFSSDMPEFNYDAQVTRDLINDVAMYWMGYGIDGYRLDAVKHIYMADESPKVSGDVIVEDIATIEYYDEELRKTVQKEVDYSTNTTKNIAFWKEFSSRIKAVYPNCFLVAENLDGWDLRIAPYYQAFDSQLDFNSYYHNQEYLYLGYPSGKTASTLATETTTKLNEYFGGYRSDAINSTFTSNHDVSRAINHINSTRDGDVKITGTQTEINKAKVHAAVTILQPGISFIYYGDELGMSSNTTENTEAHANSLDRFYRQPFKWADASERCEFTFGDGYSNAYDSYNLTLADLSAQQADTNSMYSFYKDLTTIKSDPNFPNDGTYTGYTYNDNQNVNYYLINPKGSGYRYQFWIHSGATLNSQSGSINPYVNGEEIVYSWNYDSGSNTLNPYGLLVTRTAV